MIQSEELHLVLKDGVLLTGPAGTELRCGWLLEMDGYSGNGNIMYSYDGISWSDSVGGIHLVKYGIGIAYGTSGDGTPMWVAVGQDRY